MTDSLPWYRRLADNIQDGTWKFLFSPAKVVRDFGAPYREKNKSKYYHRKYRRVTPIEDCYEDDAMCWFEAFHQYNRDRRVDETILLILRQRMLECCLYYGEDKKYKCVKETQDYQTAEAHWFTKHGDLGRFVGDPEKALRKQQHRVAWERRHKKRMIDGLPLDVEEMEKERQKYANL